ncbi:MauE/DoxX family redox-associated membrane protein [Capillimicrobium parvum]|uniref:MauE/DoxX family redox-associated membrane protein n=1 Tax=Capillimicrobium parvum TaxID=2884022 RepID=UPI00216ABCBB|nr:MauE/DoxX family redox-associated membrane protein [Capillimicrobium parvum]
MAGLLLGALLALAAAQKLAAPRSSAAALATFGIRGARAQWAAWSAVVAAELALAVTVAVGLDAAAFAAAALMAAFGLAQGVALARGRRGAPCACFGARSTVGPAAVARNAVLAVAFAAVPFLPDEPASTEAWLGLGLAVCGLAVAGLVVAVLALAREVGMLRLAIGPQQALEIPSEGPALGAPAGPLLAATAPTDRTRLALAVFASEGCRMCQAVAPGVAMLARDDALAVATLDEVRDAELWRVADVPGSPYAVALDPRDGTVLAKGTFNGLAQLESVLATAERRMGEAVHG